MIQKQYTEAEDEINEARRLAPEYFEVHRVNAWLKTAQDNITQAQISYEAAVELEPEHPPLLVWYAEFLLRYLDDTETALEYFLRAVELDPKAFDAQWGIAKTSLYLSRFVDASNALDTILETQDRLNTEKLRKVYDLYLQVYRRKAEFLMVQGHYEEALEALDKLTNVYQGCPTGLIDNRILEILRKAFNDISNCPEYFSDETRKYIASRIQTWLYEELSKWETIKEDIQIGQKYRGVIARLHPEKPFGFVRRTDGVEFYFHKNDLSESSDWEILHENSEIEFIVGANARGLCAKRLRLSNN